MKRKARYPDDTHEAKYAYGRGSCEVAREETADEPRAVSGEGEAGAFPFTSRLPCEGSPHAAEVGSKGDVGESADEGGCNRGRPGRLHEGGERRRGAANLASFIMVECGAS